MGVDISKENSDIECSNKPLPEAETDLKIFK